MKRNIISLMMLLALALTPLVLRAQNQAPPGQISYQGFLTDANGLPLATNAPRNVTVNFRIYNGSGSSATVLWGEQQVVTVDRGYFSVMLGAGSSIGAVSTNNLTSIFTGGDASDRYLGITVTDLGALEIVPRLRMLSSPYALLAANAIGIAGTNTITANNLGTNIGVWTVAGTNVFRAAGNVAIGKSTAATTLDVNGTVTATSFSGSGTSLSGIPTIAGANVFTGSQTYGSDNGGTTFNFFSKMDLYSEFLHGLSAALTLHNSPSYGSQSGGIAIAMLGPSPGDYWSTDAQANDITVRSTAGRVLLQSGTGASAMCISTANRVGIGTTSPGVPLDVVGGVITGASGSQASWFFGTSTTLSHLADATANFATYSIRANNFIVGGGIAAISDERIKNIKGHSDSSADLHTLMGIEITDFLFKDVIAKGNRPQKKVIAQQVEKIFPQAVSQMTDVVPDIYKVAMCKNGWVDLATNLKVGDRVRLILETGAAANNPVTYDVLEATNDKFRVDFKNEVNQNEAAKVFVYGREVKDFRVVDYEAIAMLNVSATQELAKKLAAQNLEFKARMEKLEAREAQLADLEQKAVRVTALEQQMADLQKVVAKLAESGKSPKLAAQPAPQNHAASEQKVLTTASLDR